MFTAAIVPAITQVLLYCMVIVALCHFKPNIAPATARATWAERRVALLRIVDIGLLVLLVIGGIALGWFTPPEAASVGAVGALRLMRLAKTFELGGVGPAPSETLRTSGMIYVVIIGALIFSVFISLTGIAEQSRYCSPQSAATESFPCW